MNCKYYFILLSFFIISVVYSERVMICDGEQRLSQFHVKPSPKCWPGKVPYFVKTCSGQIFSPLAQMVSIPVVSCSLVTTKWTGVAWFFGARTQKQFDPISLPLEASRCRQLSRTLNDPELGKLQNLGEGYYSTLNEVMPKYLWPGKSTVVVKNVVVVFSNASYDHIHKKMLSPLDNLVHCAIGHQVCRTMKFTFLWSWDDNMLCPASLRDGLVNKTSVKIDLHYHSNDKFEPTLSNIDIMELGLTYFSQVQCKDSTLTCFPGKKPVCLIDGSFLLMENCNVSSGLKFFKDSLHPLLSGDSLKDMTSEDGQEAATLNFSHELMGIYARHMATNLKLLECRVTSAVTSLLAIVAKSHPSEVLSFLTQRETAGIVVGDTMELLSCNNFSVTVLPSMQFRGQFLSRPLLSFQLRNESRVAQFFPDLRGYMSIGFIEKYNPSQRATFFIGGHYYNFQNYSLVDISDKQVVLLNPQLEGESVTLPRVDFQHMFRRRPNEHHVSNDFSNVLSMVLRNREFSDKLKQYFTNNDPDVMSTAGTHVMGRSSVSSYLSYVQNPFVMVVLLLLQFISHCWALLLTIYLIRYLCTKYCCKSKKVKYGVNIVPPERSVRSFQGRDSVSRSRRVDESVVPLQ